MIEKMYADFTTQMLPAIQTGLTITKDYFTDLFGRYVQYLIVTDSIDAAVSLIVFIASIVLFTKTKNKLKEVLDWNDKNDYYERKEDMQYWIACAGCILGIIFGAICFLGSLANLVKDIYIPEVRVFEKIQNMRDASSQRD